MACLQGPHGEFKQSSDRETWGTYISLLGSMGGVLWSSWARARLVHSNQKNEVLIRPMEVGLI